MDFTFKTYENLLNTLLTRGFSFMTYAQYVEAKSLNLPTVIKEVGSQIFESLNLESLNLIVLRHDVEARYPNALRMAQIQHKLGIKGSYYFRIFPKPGNEAIIQQIASLGHEIGYHYDDLTACNGNHQKALQRFQKNLNYLRQFAPVTTITMEGAPLSKYDNRDLWSQNPTLQPSSPPIFESLNQESLNFESLNYTHFGILAEPYFDLNFNQIFYLTDTGRRWDGHHYNLRDKATKENPLTNPHFLKLRFHSTFDLIKSIESLNPKFSNLSGDQRETGPQIPTVPRAQRFGIKSSNPESLNFESLNFESFPKQAMLNFHPQRWNDKPMPWLKELIWQNVKNQGKRLLLTLRK